MKIFSVEGNIGSGKSTYLNCLKTYYENNDKIIFLQEPVDSWNEIVDSNGVNILSKYYSNQERYAFSFQMMAFITRLKQITDTIKEYINDDVIIITERSIYTDREIFAKMLFDSGKIEDVEYTIYLKWYDYFVKDIVISGILYIKTIPSVCQTRIKLRNRAGEDDINIEYLMSLHEYHEKWLVSGENVYFLDGNLNSHDLISNKVHEFLFEDSLKEDSEDSDEIEHYPIPVVNTLNQNIINTINTIIPISNFIIIFLPFVYPYLINLFKD